MPQWDVLFNCLLVADRLCRDNPNGKFSIGCSRKYLECIHGHAGVGKCRSGKTWDGDKQKCRSTSKVDGCDNLPDPPTVVDQNGMSRKVVNLHELAIDDHFSLQMSVMERTWPLFSWASAISSSAAVSMRTWTSWVAPTERFSTSNPWLALTKMTRTVPTSVSHTFLRGERIGNLEMVTKEPPSVLLP